MIEITYPYNIYMYNLSGTCDFHYNCNEITLCSMHIFISQKPDKESVKNE